DAVVHAPAGEPAEPWAFQVPVRHARGDNERPRLDLSRALEHQGSRRPPGLEADNVARYHQLSTKTRYLRERALGEVRTAQALRESQIVLDCSALPGLAAGRFTLDHHRAQALRRRIDRGSQAGRARADYAHVVEPLPGARPQPKRPGELQRRRRPERVAIGDEHERQLIRR